MSTISGIVWDACALLNLMATRYERQVLASFGCQSYVVREVLKGEVLYLRPLPEEDSSGSLVTVDTASIIQTGMLEEITLTAEEQADFITFASQMDDGEARSAAVALRRGWKLVTDDRISLRVAGGNMPIIQTMTTPEYIKHWADHASVDERTLSQVLRRIELCASYRPRRQHLLRNWWDKYRMES